MEQPRACPKPVKGTPETRKKRKTEVREIKRAYHPELYQERMVKADPSQHDRFKVTGSSLHSVSKKRLQQNKGRTAWSTFDFREAAERLKHPPKVRRSTKPWRNLAARHDWTKTPKVRAKLRQVGERAKRWAKPLAEWKTKVRAVWGSCIITGWTPEQALERGTWVDAHHCYDQATDGDKRFDVPNGILLRRDMHQLADTYPELHKALQAIADEQYAAEAGRRLPVKRQEARQIIFQRASKMRQYARAEED